jgi:hypothetical protein
LLLVFAVLTLAAPLTACGGPSTSAPAPVSTTAVTPVEGADLSCAKPGVERPNCGVKPQQAGDRGGALQYTVWALLIVALVIVFSVVFRSAKRTNDAKRQAVGDRNWS